VGDHSFTYGEGTIRYRIRWQPERKVSRIAIHVEPTGEVWVDAPFDATEPAILAAVKKRARWIHGHVADFQHRRRHTLPREYVSGEAVMYLGRRYRLKVIAGVEGGESVRLSGGLLEVRVPVKDRHVVSAAMDRWYGMRARTVILQRLEELAAHLRWVRTPPPLRFQRMKVQWGSCSPAGRLTLNPYLVKAPRECIDYVLLHELCHLRHHNHSRSFYQLLGRHLPQWAEVKKRLDDLAEQILNR
jgi:predicted metal-dependent hydrolase